LDLNTDIFGMRLRAWLALLAPLALAGCYSPYIVNGQDEVYCAKKGFLPGTDANVKCAMDRDERRGAGDPTAAIEPVTPKPFLTAEAPPSHTGGVPQSTPRSIPPGTSRLINFTIAVDKDCVVHGLPEVKFTTTPVNGTVIIYHITDFARLSQIGAPASCTDKRVAGLALVYRPKKNFAGDDLVEFSITTPAGRTDFKVPITVEDPDDD
jgi:hypothetical protein